MRKIHYHARFDRRRAWGDGNRPLTLVIPPQSLCRGRSEASTAHREACDGSTREWIRPQIHGNGWRTRAEQSRVSHCRQDHRAACRRRRAGEGWSISDAARRNRPTPGARGKAQRRCAARATVVQTDADEQRYASLVSKDGRPDSAMNRRKPRRIQPRRNSPPPKPKRGSPRTRPPRSWWRTRMERWSKRSASRGKLSPLAKPSSGLPSPAPGGRCGASRDSSASDRLGGRGPHLWKRWSSLHSLPAAVV